jgi:hypothetical protein
MKHRELFLLATILLFIIQIPNIAAYQDPITDADKYFSVSRGEYQGNPDPRFAPDPRSSRKIWQKDEQEPANPENNSTVKSGSSEDQANAASSATKTDSTSDKIQFAGVAGMWNISLEKIGSLDVSLFQKGDLVFGHGVTGDSSSSGMVSAVGSVVDKSLNLDLISFEVGGLYQMRIDLRKGDGTYIAILPSGRTWTGTAKATKADVTE